MYIIKYYDAENKIERSKLYTHKQITELLTQLESTASLDITNKTNMDNYYSIMNQYNSQGSKNKWR